MPAEAVAEAVKAETIDEVAAQAQKKDDPPASMPPAAEPAVEAEDAEDGDDDDGDEEAADNGVGAGDAKKKSRCSIVHGGSHGDVSGGMSQYNQHDKLEAPTEGVQVDCDAAGCDELTV